ncbi:hypothetical protein PV08_00883 [Exophiala spinifera]|uniref:Asteroid domain-containing protein n=1 Tax=Exophiala spinifera TaxID=91928 RepID=A0A0D2BMY9_9EURO|nr:uncharacterized protein PV08_00883 [Exophiala spinifera]KIW20308.1 hypothetical protein PV08_00883 [Exophiala spinifera]
MGIARLSQDLLPYAERTALSASQASQEEPKPVTSLIIDGPSLVYYIYNKLLAYKISTSPTLVAQQPSYEEINQSFTKLLLHLDTQGVELQKVFFDGALPIAKREIRLERMEKLRQQLEMYRKTFPELPILPTLPRIDHGKALWSTPIISSRKLALPAPPFMVASVIECLRTSRWRDIVQVVPGEADIFCAILAKTSGGAIMTNDSDMAVHDLGSEGRIVLLHSLEKKAAVSQTGKSNGLISALAFNPRRIAERLQVSSLLRFGFERYLDPSLSVAMVKERAREIDRLDDLSLREEYKAFSEQYEEESSISSPLHHLHQQQKSLLDDLDPRIAEAVLCPDSPTVYLTPLNEDPSRDSSWSYGFDIRHVAYSLLLRCSAAATIIHGGTVTEYARKGQRITSTIIKCLDLVRTQERMMALLQSLPADTTTTNPPPPLSTSPTCHMLLQWYTLALQFVSEQRLASGKTPLSADLVLDLFGLPHHQNPPVARQQTRLSWDEMHILGNMHAVLYSFRILRQLTRYVMASSAKEAPPQTHELVNMLPTLLSRLDRMPNIQDLFLDKHDLRRAISELDIESRNLASTDIKSLLSPTANLQGEGQLDVGQQLISATRDGDGEWEGAKSKRKRKRATQSDTLAPGPRSRSANMFDLLGEI